jgi:hypothetical protein
MPGGRIAAMQAKYFESMDEHAVRRTSFNKEMIARAKRAAYERIIQLLTAELEALQAKARKAWLAAQAAAKREAEMQAAADRARIEAEEVRAEQFNAVRSVLEQPGPVLNCSKRSSGAQGRGGRRGGGQGRGGAGAAGGGRGRTEGQALRAEGRQGGAFRTAQLRTAESFRTVQCSFERVRAAEPRLNCSNYLQAAENRAEAEAATEAAAEVRTPSVPPRSLRTASILNKTILKVARLVDRQAAEKLRVAHMKYQQEIQSQESEAAKEDNLEEGDDEEEEDEDAIDAAVGAAAEVRKVSGCL